MRHVYYAACYLALPALIGRCDGWTWPSVQQRLGIAHVYEDDANGGHRSGSDQDATDFAAPAWKVTTQRQSGQGLPEAYNTNLLPLKFEPFPLGSIRPLGWLRQQMDLMADSLPGHLHEFYRFVKDSPWLGGDQEYSALNEAWPYSFNSLVSLAWTTDNARLQHHVRRVTEWVIRHQHADGWLGPETEVRRRALWARYPLFLGFIQLADAEPQLGQTLILPAMHRFVRLMRDMLANHHQGYVWKPGDLFEEQWGRSRVADMILALQWLYDYHPMENGEALHQCMVALYEQAYDWSDWFHPDHFLSDDLDLLPDEITQSVFPFVHGVNAGQGLKWGAVMRRLTHDERLLNSTRNGVRWTFQYHGTPSGAIIGDEREAGLSPVRGTELCSVVETIFSLNYLYHAVGDRELADRSELTAYNALPVMVMPHWWAHQYVAQTNQPISQRLDASPFWNVGSDGQTFGMEPHYPCCTVNMQGYSKHVAASFVQVGNDGVAHVLLGPVHVRATLRDRNNLVRIRCETNYPFAHHLDYEIMARRAFRFSFRVPAWALLDNSGVRIDSGRKHGLAPDPITGLHTLIIPAGRTRVEVWFDAVVRVEARANHTVSVYHGALLYALPIAGEYHASRPERHPGTPAPPQARDWTILPREPWNVAIDTSTLRFYEYPNRYNRELPHPIWHEDMTPVSISGLACEIDWRLVNGYAPNPPPVGQRNCTGRAFPIELRPYGSAKLHMAELPTVNLRPGSPDLWDGSSVGHGDVL